MDSEVAEEAAAVVDAEEEIATEAVVEEAAEGEVEKAAKETGDVPTPNAETQTLHGETHAIC